MVMVKVVGWTCCGVSGAGAAGVAAGGVVVVSGVPGTVKSSSARPAV
jgi:hypothetical protein